MTNALTFALIGHPVGHSLSQVMHRAAFAELGLPHDYQLLDCPDEDRVKQQLSRLKGRVIAGLNVTVPHKRLALSLADEGDTSALRVGAANVLACVPEGGIRAYNTDALALAEEIRKRVAAPSSGLVIGNGGAALAAVVACRMLGCGAVHVVARHWDQERSSEFERLGATLHGFSTEGQASQALEVAAGRSQVVLQATSSGMLGADSGETVSRLVPWAKVAKDSLALDLVYNPVLTPFVRVAKAAGLYAESGLGMLVGQAALSLKLWLGIDPPRAVMRQAAERALRKTG